MGRNDERTRKVTLRRSTLLKKRENGYTLATLAEHYGVGQATISRFLTSEEDSRVVRARSPKPLVEVPPLAQQVQVANEALAGSLSVAEQSGLVPKLRDLAGWMRARGIARLAVELEDDAFSYVLMREQAGKVSS